MDLPFPEKYHAVARYFDIYIGDIEQSPLLTDAQRLLFYALRQQADHGPCTTPQPSMWYMTERHKHQAWQQVSHMSTFEAMVFFVQQFEAVLATLEQAEGATNAAGEATRPMKIDWAARLKEAGVTAPSDEVNHAAPTAAVPSDVTAAVRAPSCEHALPPVLSSAYPFSSSSTPRRTPSPPLVRAGEMDGWDADVVAHAALSLDNIRYLAEEVMRARRALRQAMSPLQINAAAAAAAPRYDTEEGRRMTEELHFPLPPLVATTSAAAGAATAPPLKPMWTIDGTQRRVPIVPPPVRFSARSLTEAAVRQSRESWAAPLSPAVVPAPVPAQREAGGSWFGW